ncbi:MAG: hypothetical protein ACREBP_09860, partial [Sphingomicrobium sp.]
YVLWIPAHPGGKPCATRTIGGGSLEAALFLASTPQFTIRHWIETQPIRDQATGEHFAEGYRKAGLPE